jgi:hypothetical protein
VIEKILPDAVACSEAFDDPPEAVLFPEEEAVISTRSRNDAGSSIQCGTAPDERCANSTCPRWRAKTRYKCDDLRLRRPHAIMT